MSGQTEGPVAWSPDAFEWRFVDGDRCELHIGDAPPVFFDGTRARTRNWLRTKHADGAMHEPNFAFVLARLVELVDPAVYFDIGGFIGYFTVLPLSWLRRTARVYTFEMNPQYVRQIQVNLEQNRHLSISRAFVVNAGVGPDTRLAHEASIEGFTLGAGVGGTNTTIDLLSLDYVADTMGVVPDLVKLDIEGWEAAAFDGATEVLATARPTILFELHSDEFLAPHGHSRRSVLELLEAAGYSLFALRGDRYSAFDPSAPLRRVDPEVLDQVLSLHNSSFVATPSERESAVTALTG